MRIRKVRQHGTIDSINAQKGEISSNRPQGVMIWQEEKDHLYITCPACDSINDITDHPVGLNGRISPCVVCINCQTHFFPTLKDWDGRITVQCGKCSISRKVVNTKKGLQGWKSVPVSCGCCKMMLCPKCV